MRLFHLLTIALNWLLNNCSMFRLRRMADRP